MQQGWVAPASRREEEIEVTLRRRTQLVDGQRLRPVPRAWKRLAEADQCARSLVAGGQYTKEQVGVFARELTSTGAREFFVETHAGLALTGAPRPLGEALKEPLPPIHLYEVIMEWQPCWLYFDLEFSRVVNPRADPATVIEAFYATLNSFCSTTFGAALDMEAVFELDSSTPEKFSKHVIAKRLQSSKCQGSVHGDALAFKNNMQAGSVVSDFVAYLQSHRQQPDSGASCLFFQKEAKSATLPSDTTGETCLVDTSVYSRNRCFRILFSSKYRKCRPLILTRGACLNQSLPAQLLETLVAFVPVGTMLFHHSTLSAEKTAGGMCRTSTLPHRNDSSIAAMCRKEVPAKNNRFLQYLIDVWDKVRQDYESNVAVQTRRETSVQSVVRLGEEEMFMAVSLAHNRFCHNKGASHKSNGIYLVVDYSRRVFYQKCHDVDCHRFRSAEYSIPHSFFNDQSQENDQIKGDSATAGDVPAGQPDPESSTPCKTPQIVLDRQSDTEEPRPRGATEMARVASQQQGVSKSSSQSKLSGSQLVRKPAPATPEKLPIHSSILSQRILDLRCTPTKANKRKRSPQIKFNVINSGAIQDACAEKHGAAGQTCASNNNWQKLPSHLYTVSSDESQTEHETELETELDTNSETEEAPMFTSMAQAATQQWMSWFQQFLSEDLSPPASQRSKRKSFASQLEQLQFEEEWGCHSCMMGSQSRAVKGRYSEAND